MIVFSVESRTLRRWLWLAVGLLAIFAAFALDSIVDGSLYQPTFEPARRTASLVSKFGDWPAILVAGVVVITGLMLCRKFELARVFLIILLAGLFTGFAATVIRSTTGRTRPSAGVPQGFYGPRHHGKWIVGKYDFGSFPSGHTAVWAGLTGAAWMRRRQLGVVFVGGALVVGWSRIALGCHHFSDVTASLVFGLAVGPWLARRMETVASAHGARTEWKVKRAG